MKKVLGLDLGTNSIGWALVNAEEKKILGMGSRIIPTDTEMLSRFNSGLALSKANAGQSFTATGKRTDYRGIRRIRERHLLRRERLHRVLNVLKFLPEHYAKEIDFEKHFGQFVNNSEPKLTYNNRDFIFISSFEEMLRDFKQSQPKLFYTKPNGKETKIPYDWTIYFLRKKALSEKIAKEELAWIILNFNQKRGYYQLRGEEEEENPNKLVEFHSLEIVDVIVDEKPNSKGDLWYSLYLENGWVYRRSSKIPLFDWKDKVRDFIVTTDLNDDGTIKTDKDGNERRSFRAPSEDDWTLLKKKTEQEIDKSRKTVGAYIYENLLQNPSQKIRGKLVRTIERKFYKDELIAILKKQIELQPELFSDDLYNDCVCELYRNNEAQQLVLSKRDFVHLFVEDIIFYQRPLRSQKSSIGNCTLEKHPIKDKDGKIVRDDNGKPVLLPLKVISKSHPLYQEFRVWQWLSNLKIYRKEDDADVTSEFLKSTEDIINLFEFLMAQKEVGHKDILKHLINPILKEKFPNAKPAAFNKEVEKDIAKYRWNYVFDDSKEKEEDKSKKYPCNTTGYEIRRRFEKVANIPTDFLTSEIEQHLWHIIYSVTDKKEYETALRSFANKYKLDENSFVEEFKKFPPFPSEYGAYSEKAIKKLLPVMRLGKYWSWNAIDTKTQSRIEKIITGEYDESIKTRVREKAINLIDNNHFQGLPIWLASYVIYDRHSEADIAGKWNSVADLEQYLEDFKQHSLRNPIVEQVITETLRVVRDIWKQYGQGVKDFFSEIHVELGREMKNTAEDRKYMTEQVTNNEATNLRIKALLAELKENSDGKLPVENVRPFSPMQQDALRIYEEYALQCNERYVGKDVNGNDNFEYSPIDDEILKISKSSQPTKSELQRYKLWLEQRYRSPYTGEMIPLGKLFTADYEIEHVIPKSRYFDDSFSNKVICESVVNKNPYKDNQLGLEFIKNKGGSVVDELSNKNKIVKIFTEDEYRNFVNEHYAKSKTKRQNLLLEEIPEKMIARQMNDTRYISKFISLLLSNIVRADKEDDGINSKNLIPGNGKITTVLKKDWGLDAVWNDLILPRFERLNKLTNTDAFTYWNEQHQKFLPVDSLDIDSKGVKRIEKKRIDHRHHAMDALVIACMTRDHVNYLNNKNAHEKGTNDEKGFRYDLKNKLCFKTKPDDKGNYIWQFKKPWSKIENEALIKADNDFTIDAKNKLETVVVSFKKNLRVINKATNNYEKWIAKDGRKVKIKVKQEGKNWAIRKSLHEKTISGKVNLPWVKVSKGNFLTATRKNLDTSFTLEKIRKITDTGIQKILEKHLKRKENNPEVAFSPEGIEEMNGNLLELNDGKKHKPIYKVRLYEMGSSRFALGTKNNNPSKFVQGSPNLYFAIYIGDNKKIFETIPLNIVIEQLKQGLNSVPERNKEGLLLHDVFSPLDLIYIPTEEEIEMPHLVDFRKLNKIQMKRLYNVNDFSGVTAYFSQNSFAKNIYPKEMDLNWNEKKKKLSGSFDNKTSSYDKKSIKDFCIKLKVDRLGNILINY